MHPGGIQSSTTGLDDTTTRQQSDKRMSETVGLALGDLLALRIQIVENLTKSRLKWHCSEFMERVARNRSLKPTQDGKEIRRSEDSLSKTFRQIPRDDDWNELVSHPMSVAAARFNNYLFAMWKFVLAANVFLRGNASDKNRILRRFGKLITRAPDEYQMMAEDLDAIKTLLDTITTLCSHFNSLIPPGNAAESLLGGQTVLPQAVPLPRSIPYDKQFPVENFDLQGQQATEKSVASTLTHPLKRSEHQHSWESLNSIDHTQRHAKYRAQRLDGTCQWILNQKDFVHWRKGPAASTLWCVGAPGAGKSVLSSMIIDELANENARPVAYFYMAYGKVQSTADLAASLLSQLAAQDDSISARVEESMHLFVAKKGPKVVPPLDLLRKCLAQGSQKIKDALIVIDAFDADNMTSEHEFRDFITFLSNLKWRVFITRRLNEISPVTEIPDSEQSRIIMEEQYVEADIRLLVETGFDNFVETHAHSPLFKTLKADIVNSVVESSGGKFFKAAVHLDVVLQQSTVSDIRGALGNPTDEFPALKAIEAIDRQPRDQRSLARITLIWVASIKWPLTIGGVSHALAMNSIDHRLPISDANNRELVPIQDRLVESCKGLLAVDPTSSTVALSHHETQKHILESWSSATESTIYPLSVVSLKYLLLKDFEGRECENEDELRQLVQDYEFLEYAAHCWFKEENDREIPKPARGSPEIQRPGGQSPVELSSSTTKAGADMAAQAHENSIEVYTVKLIMELLDKKQNLFLAMLVYFYSKYHTNPDGPGWEVFRQRALSTSPLHVAARFGLLDVTRKLLTLNASDSIRAKNSYGQTPLHEAVRKGHVDVVEALIVRMDETLVADANERMPIHYAFDKIKANPVERDAKSNQRHTNIFNLLMKAHVEQLFSIPRDIDSTVRGSVESRDQKVLLPLRPLLDKVPARDDILAQFISSNWVYAKRLSPKDLERDYIRAVEQKDLTLAVVLLEKGVNPDTLSEKKTPALHLAIQQRSEPLVRAILGYKGKPSICSGNFPEESALQSAIRIGAVNIVRRLLSANPPLAHFDKDSNSALSQAVITGNGIIVKLVLDSGAPWHTPDAKKPTVLFHALDGTPEIMKLLLDRSVDMEKTNDEGCTVLYQAVERRLTPMVTHLLQNGANVLAVNSAGDGILHAAARAGDPEITNEIILCLRNYGQHHQELGRANKNGETPADVMGDPLTSESSWADAVSNDHP